MRFQQREISATPTPYFELRELEKLKSEPATAWTQFDKEELAKKREEIAVKMKWLGELIRQNLEFSASLEAILSNLSTAGAKKWIVAPGMALEKKIKALEDVSGMLEELDPKQIEIFEEAVKRRPLFK